MLDMDKVIDFINVNRERYLDELKALLAIPSISALPQHAADVKRCAEWCADEMRRIGLQNVRLVATPGNPVVYGEWMGAPGAPTILFYGHYDVQPVDPLDLWESPPFEATIRDGEIFARGSADDKGQVFMHFKAVEAHLKQNGRLPVNIKFILEGEEEVGQRKSRRLRPRPQTGARGRRRRDLGLGDVRPRHSLDLLRPARPRVFPDRLARQQHRPALGLLRRRRRQPRVRARADDRADEGSRRPRQDSRLLRRCRAAAGDRARGVEEAAVQRKEIQEGFRDPEAVRRERLHDARADVGAADARGQRSAVGLHRRGREDRAAGRGDGEDQHAPRAEPGSEQDRGALRGVREEAGAEDRHVEDDEDARREAVDDLLRQPVRAGRRPRDREGLREKARVSRAKADRSPSSRRFRRSSGCRRCCSASACRTKTRTRRTRSSTCRTSTTGSSRPRISTTRWRTSRVDSRVAPRRSSRPSAEILRRAAGAAGRSVHAVCVGGAVGALGAAQARRRARRA